MEAWNAAIDAAEQESSFLKDRDRRRLQDAIFALRKGGAE
jgi:hypothetical protein